MSTLSLQLGRPTLVDRLFSRSLTTDLVLIVAGAALTAVAAQLSVPMWPVPITAQTFAVLLVGSTLGSLRGALSLAVYLVMGVAGLPVFADGTSGSLLGSTTGGYIVGFIFAAALTGFLAERRWDRRAVGTLVSFLAGSATIYLFGLPWLFVVLNGMPQATLLSAFGTGDVLLATIVGGLLPFLIGDAIKALVAAGLLPTTWRLIHRADRRRG